MKSSSLFQFPFFSLRSARTNSSKKLSYYLILFFVISLSFASCSDKNKVKVSNTNFKDEVEIIQNLVFTFNKDIVPDSMCNNWGSSDYIVFEPNIPGRFKWSNTHELMFSPSQQLAPCTNYKATIKETILSQAPKEYRLGGTLLFEFHTAPLRVEDARVFWPKGANGKPLAELSLQFNYPVNPKDIADHLKLKTNDKTIEFKLAKAEINSTVVLNLTYPPNQADKDIPLFVTIANGVTVPGSKSSSEKEITYETVLPSRFRMVVQQVNANYSDNQGTVDVYTSEEVMEENLLAAITIQPQIKFKVEKNSHGFFITSNQFSLDVSYLLTIKNMKGVLGAEMKEVYNEQLVFGEINPDITFNSSKGLYLGSKGKKNIGISIVNIPKVKITIAKIYANNLLPFLKSGTSSEYSYDDGNYSEYSVFDFENYGDVIYEKLIATKSLKKSGNNSLLNFDFTDKLKDKNGIYVLTVQSENEYWISASKIISLTDIGLIVKEGKQKTMVFANSIQTATPLSNLKIQLISTNNQVIDEIQTDSKGVATFIKKDSTFPNYKMGLIVAETKGDYNFLYPNNDEVTTSRFEVGGKYLNSNYDAFIYSERSVYRPGETVHLSGIVRNRKWQVPGDLPITLKFMLPNGKEYKSIKKIINEEGSFESDINIPVGMITGTYTADVYTADNILLGSKSISIEEFMPDRIKLTTSVSTPELKLTDTLSLNLFAENYFGPPAANRNYEVQMNLSRENFYAKDFKDYNFTINNPNINFNRVSRIGKTNAKGKATEKFIDYEDYENCGLINAALFTTVYDENGRPVNRVNNVKIFSQKIFYGIKNFGTYVSTRQNLQIPMVAVDQKGRVQKNVKVGIMIIKNEWETVIEKVGTKFRYNSQRREHVLQNKTLLLNGPSYFNFLPELSGDYEVRLYIPNTTVYISQSFYAYGYGNTESTSFEVDNEGTIDISIDKEKNKVGETSKILFKTPFSGKLLVTVEQDNLLEYYVLNTDKKAAELKLKLTDAHVPNIFISATLIRPNTDGSNPLIIARGYKNILVENPKNHPECTINAVAVSRSKTTQPIKIKTIPNAMVTVAIVDEGILALKNEETPDPYAYFYEPRALQVNSYDLYPFLFPELVSGKLNKGGDRMNIGKRVNPLSNKRVKLVSLWSGIRKTNSSGELTIPMVIPQFSGDLRIMVVAYKDNQFTNAESHMKVADPIVLSNGLPRFTSPLDTVIMPVTISNTTKQTVNGTITISCTGGLKLVNGNSSKVTIKPNSEFKIDAKIFTPALIGNATVSIVVNALGEKFSDQTDITIRPASSLQKRTGSGTSDPKLPVLISLAQDFMPSSTSSKVIISRSPFIQFTKDLTYLIEYPHGCLEQTISAAFPQIYYNDLVKSIMSRKQTMINPAQNVQYAIKKIESMQLSNGALTYWLGGDDPCDWGSVYAAHFLLEAKKAGFEVNPKALKELQEFLTVYIKRHETIQYYYNKGLYRTAPNPNVLYAIYVLALAGKSPQAEMNYYAQDKTTLTTESKYLLAAAFALSGNKSRFKALLPSNFASETADITTSGYYNSTLKSEALALNALVETDINNSQIGILAKHLSEQLKGPNTYWNTQERSFALLVLGKIAKKMMSTNANAQIFVDGKFFQNFSGNDVVLQLNNSHQNVKIVTTTGHLFYYYETEGISANGTYVQEDKFIKVRRTILSKAGALLGMNKFNQNDLIVIKLTITNMTENSVENVAITDLLPAGFEIENPRIKSVPGMSWINDNAYYTNMDIRDDRITYFTNLENSETKSFYYIVRAVAKGTYNQGPVSADAMYAGEYHSYFGAGKVIIR